MPVPQTPVLKFPAMFHGPTDALVHTLKDMGHRWGREYLETGGFAQPRQMLEVPIGELLIMHAGAELDIIPCPRWRIHLFLKVLSSLSQCVPEKECPRVEEAFESFCLSTSWGALYHAVSPPPIRSAEATARRLAALLRFWDILQGPRYGYRMPGTWYTLDELMEDLYGMALEAWCPGDPSPVRERLARMVERMSRATREECIEAVLRVSASLVRASADLKHRERLGDPDFLRECLTGLSSEDWEDVSGTNRYAVNGLVRLWDRELGRPPAGSA